MIRSLYAIPAMLCVTAIAVTAQAPAGDKPAGNPPAAEQPTAQQPPAAPRPTTPPSSAQEPARPSESSTSAANKVTYTGCVKPGTTSGTWILEDAEAAQKAGASSPGAGATPGAVGTSGTSKMSLSLEPASTVNLTPHANHKVEVVGQLSPAKAGSASPSAAEGAAASRQQFSVESVKMVSGTCP
jgi:hypothetical protein